MRPFPGGASLILRRLAVVVAALVATVPAGAGADALDDAAVIDEVGDLSMPLPAKAPPGDRLGGVASGVEIGATAALVPTRPDVLDVAAAAGADFVGVEDGRLQFTGTGAELRRLHASGAVRELVPVIPSHTLGVVSEGVPLTDALDWHAAGYRGQGVVVAVLDHGFEGYADLLGSELPPAVTTASFHFDGLEAAAVAHGTAVAEIVHDVAPGADMYLVNFDDFSFDEAVDYLIAEGVDIISMSAGWTVGPFDGTSDPADAVNRAIDAGITWVNAAGNGADQHFTATFTDADADGFAELVGATEVNQFDVDAGTGFTVGLTWTNRSADLDLCVYEMSPFRLLECSSTDQSPGDDPVEFVFGANPFGFKRQYGYAVVGDGSFTRYDVFASPVENLTYQVAETSLAVPADVERVISVGGVAWSTPDTIETYSSQGPTIDGRVKPDLVAATQVSTESFALLGPFWGTSAAAPHVAGMAAVYLSAHPGTTPVTLRRNLGLLAEPRGPAGKDSVFGWGLARLGAPPPPHSWVGVQDPTRGLWTLRLPAGSDADFYYGNPSDVPVACDWDGDGIETVGLYRPLDGFLYLRNSNDFGVADVSIFYGIPEDRPVCGDWDGDGIDTIGIYRPSQARFYLRNSNTQGFADFDFLFGQPGDLPFAGDWNGDGIDTVGLYRPGQGYVYVTNSNESGFADFATFYGDPGDRFVVGDWDGDGRDSFGIYRPSDASFYLSNVLGDGFADQIIRFGNASSIPVAGLWG